MSTTHYYMAFHCNSAGMKILGEVNIPAPMKLVSVKLDEPDLRVMALRVRRGGVTGKIIFAPVVDGIPARDLLSLNLSYDLMADDKIEFVAESIATGSFRPGPHGYVNLIGPPGIVPPGANVSI